ncbi:MAG: lipase family protein [Planctomycetaceae bacterium]|nr:lipase family protein [Planctomycetaceae bacterium]
MTEETPLPTPHSSLESGIDELAQLQKSLLFAELSSISYYDIEAARGLVSQIGFSDLQFFERDGAQAYMFWNETDCVVACRGTEPHEWNDIKADANAVSVLTETFGRVHKGFNQEVDDLWPMLEDALEANEKPLWFTGHSLGGAMATICAGRCYLSEIPSMPKSLYTYGSPRVGDKRFVNFIDLDHSRWVNNNDLVTRVPPAWLGYRHSGTEWYLNRHGRIKSVNGWTRTLDRLRGFASGLLKFQVDHFADHSIDRYIDYIKAAVEESSEAG